MRRASVGLIPTLTMVVTAAPVQAGPIGGPANDEFAAATAVPPLPSIVRGSTVGASDEVNEQDDCWNPSSKSVWYRLPDGVAGPLEYSSPWANFDRVVAVYAGSDLASLRFLGCSQGPAASSPLVELRAQAGSSIYVRVAGMTAAPGASVGPIGFNTRSGAFDLKVEAGGSSAQFRPPIGDDRSAPLEITLPYAAWLPVFSAGAESRLDDDCRPAPTPGLSTEPVDTWFRWTASAPRRIVATTAGRWAASGLGVYQLTPGGLTRVACSHTDIADDHHELGDISHLAFDPIAGAEYLFQLYADPWIVESMGVAMFEAPVIDTAIGDDVSLQPGVPFYNAFIDADVVKVSGSGPGLALSEGAGIWFYGPGTLGRPFEQVSFHVEPVGAPEFTFELPAGEASFWGVSAIGTARTNWFSLGCTGEYDVTVTLMHPFTVDPDPGNDARTVRLRLDDAPVTVPGCAAAAMGANAAGRS